jgi:NADPH:quinone reductase-like Zn-dependent oxidoreductase
VELTQQGIRDISEWLRAGKFSHDIGQRFPLAETAKAHQAVEGGAIGKVLVMNSRG